MTTIENINLHETVIVIDLSETKYVNLGELFNTLIVGQYSVAQSTYNRTD